jgi:hypothetical protein
VTQPLPPSDLRARVLAAARAEPAPPRAVGVRRGALIVAAGLAASVAVLYRIGGPGPRGRPSEYYVALAVLWLMVGLVATWGGVVRGRSMLGRSATWRTLVATLTPAALLATAAAASLAWPAIGESPAGMREHLICVLFTMVFALGPLVAFATVRRRSDPVAPRLTGAAIGAASGAWGALCIELRCEHASVEHVLLGHVIPVALLTLIGVLVGAKIVATPSFAEGEARRSGP